MRCFQTCSHSSHLLNSLDSNLEVQMNFTHVEDTSYLSQLNHLSDSYCFLCWQEVILVVKHFLRTWMLTLKICLKWGLNKGNQTETFNPFNLCYFVAIFY